MTDRSQMPSSFDEDKEYNETGFQKVSRKLREEPLIPLGTALTCMALYNAWRAMRKGDHAQVQRMFRARIGAQAFTVVAIVAGGAYYGADREKRAELVKLEAQQRAEERHRRWLHELEVRDAEDRELQDTMRRRRERVEQRRAARAGGGGGSRSDGDGQGGGDGKKDDGAGADAREKKNDEVGGGGGGVLGALSSVGGWFGTKKSSSNSSSSRSSSDDITKPAEEEEKKKTEVETPKK